MKDKDTEKLGLVAGSTILIGGMFGSAIFSLSGITIVIAGPAAILSWVIAAGILFLYGLINAELSTIYPNSGGVFIFPAKSLGSSPAAGRLWGWVSAWAYLFGGMGGASFSAVYVGIYLGVAFPPLNEWHVPIAVGAVLLCGLLNIFTVKVAGQASTVLAAGLIIAMAAFIFAGLSGGNWDAKNMAPFFTQGSGGTFGFMSAVPLAMVAYGSIVAAAFMAGEIRNPNKTVPRAMTIAMAVVTGLYLLIMLTTLGLVTASCLLEAGMENIPLYAAAYKALANMPWMPYVISIAAVLALTNNILVMITLLSRTVHATAASGILPHSLSKKTRSGVPLLATAAVTVILALLSSFPDAGNFIIGMGTLCSAIVVTIVCFSLPAARKKNPGKSRFRAPGGKVLPVMILLVILACYIPGMLAGGWQLWICTAAYFAVGMGVYWLGTRRGRSTADGSSGDEENTD